MQNNFLVSIIIPVYNTEKYLNKCLDSIINQTYKNLEIIIVDNCSTDNSFEIAKKYQSNDKRIKLYKENKKSVTLARKLGIENANGKYICTIDSDDYIDEGFIETLLKTALLTNADIVQCSFKCEDAKNDIYVFENFIENIYDEGYDVLLKWMNGNMHFGSQIFTKLFKAEIIKDVFNKINKHINEGEDIMYFIYYVKKAKIIASISYIFYHYRYRYDSMSHNINLKWLLTEIIIIKKLYIIIKNEYPLLKQDELKLWKNRFIKMRINHYINYKKTK